MSRKNCGVRDKVYFFCFLKGSLKEETVLILDSCCLEHGASVEKCEDECEEDRGENTEDGDINITPNPPPPPPTSCVQHLDTGAS